MIKKDAIIIVSAGVMQIPAIKLAKELGLHVIATDMNPNAPGFAYADNSIIVDSKNPSEHIKHLKKYSNQFNLKGAFAASDCAVTVAEITDHYNLPGISPETARLSNNKNHMKQRWLRDGIPTPFGKEVKTINEAKKVIEQIGFPIIVKAVDNAASRGTKMLSSFEGLDSAIKNAIQASSTQTAIIEEFISNAEEKSVEIIVYKKKKYHISIADREFGYSPYAIETAHVDPSTKLDETQKKEIFDLVGRAADSLGIDFGPAKADIIIGDKGPMILEMPARLSGGFHSQYTTPISSGKNPIKACLQISAGLQLDEDLLHASKATISICRGLFPPQGIISEINGIKEAKMVPGIKEIIFLKTIGDTVEDYIDNSKRVCWIIAEGKDENEAEDCISQALKHIDIKVREN